MYLMFGLSKTIMSDNGSPIHSASWKEYCDQWGMKVMHSPRYHPESNDQAEANVKIIKKALYKYLLDDHKNLSLGEKWKKFLVNYRNTSGSTGDRTPLEMILEI